jgi:hypothetical protein
MNRLRNLQEVRSGKFSLGEYNAQIVDRLSVGMPCCSGSRVLSGRISRT